jgi:hypothetical protein
VPVAPALESVVACGVRVVAVQKLDVADFELLVRLANRLAVLLLLPVVPVLAEETHRLAVEQEQRAGCARDDDDGDDRSEKREKQSVSV